jgi:hypothetical protein
VSIRLASESEAAGVFVAMDAHLAECWPCRVNDALFEVAVQRRDDEEVRRLSGLWCVVMRELAVDLERACRAAFGKDGDA